MLHFSKELFCRCARGGGSGGEIRPCRRLKPLVGAASNECVGVFNGCVRVLWVSGSGGELVGEPSWAGGLGRIAPKPLALCQWFPL